VRKTSKLHNSIQWWKLKLKVVQKQASKMRSMESSERGWYMEVVGKVEGALTEFLLDHSTHSTLICCSCSLALDRPHQNNTNNLNQQTSPAWLLLLFVDDKISGKNFDTLNTVEYSNFEGRTETHRVTVRLRTTHEIAM
jgi:hypothetical protein